MVPLNLDGKIIVTTGAAGILGQHFCQEMIERGATVAAIDASEDALAKLANTIRSDKLQMHCADIRNRAAMEAIQENILDRFGRIDGLVNNAATKSPNFFDAFASFRIEDWDHVMSVNLTGAMVCCQVFGGAMAERKFGCVVNVLSIYGLVAPDQRVYEGSEYLGRPINTPAVYSASKAALWGLTKYLSSYWASDGVRVNALTPGGIFSGQNKTFIDRYSNRVPMGRMGAPAELCGALIYLLSDAASYVTGQNITVDGGLTVW